MKIKGFKLGATGQFPYGKSAPDDQGELLMALATDHAHGIIRMEFGKSIDWLAITSGQARHFAAMLIEKADELDKRRS